MPSTPSDLRPAGAASPCPALEDVLQSIIRATSPFPRIALRVIAVTAKASSAAGGLVEVLRRDAALSSRILRYANASAYAARREVTDVSQAVACLGPKHVRNLVVMATLGKLFPAGAAVGSYRGDDLWRHLVAVGTCARMIAMRREIENFEDAFLAGMLHDLGILLEDRFVHESFREVIQALSKAETLVETEREHLGFDHAALGGEVARSWGLPAVVIAAIRYHHASEEYLGDWIGIVRCVEVANLVCTLRGISSVGVKLVEAPRAVLAALRLDSEDLAMLTDDLDRELARGAALLSLEGKSP